jgi:hypothetical protein
MHAQICVLVFIHFSDVTPRTSKREEGAEDKGRKVSSPTKDLFSAEFQPWVQLGVPYYGSASYKTGQRIQHPKA